MTHESSQFDILTGELTNQERRQMLAAIRKSMESKAVPISPVEEPEPPRVDVQIQSLGIWDRFRLFVIQIFTGKSSEEVIQSWIMKSLQDRLAKMNLDGVDARNRRFTEEFARSVDLLKAKAMVLAPVFEITYRERTELILGLAMQFFPGVHQELVRKTDEEYIRSLQEESERFLKRQLTSKLEEMVADIPTTSRNGIKNALDQADSLYRLSNFSFSGMLASFEGFGEGGGRHCAFEYLTRGMEELQNILSSLTGPIDLALLETVVMLTLEFGDARDDEHLFQEAVRNGLADLMDALGVFRNFSETYPLTLMLRIIKEDPWWHPKPDRSGEDWASLYRTFFLDRIQRMVLQVSLERQVKKQIDSLEEIAGEAPYPVVGLPNGTDGIRSFYWYQAVAMKTMAGKLWTRILPHLKIVLTGGEFYKSSNRAQFNDAYNEFEKIPDKIAVLEKNLSLNGPWGSIIWGDGVIAQKRKMAIRVDQDLLRAVEETQTTVEQLVNVLGGILYARPGSSYDTLANYGQIGGRRNAEVIDELKETFTLLQSFMGIMGEFGAIEKRAKENDISLDTTLYRKESRNIPKTK